MKIIVEYLNDLKLVQMEEEFSSFNEAFENIEKALINRNCLSINVYLIGNL